MTTYRALLAALLLSPSLLLAASLNQSAWVPNTSNYEYGHNSIPNMQITGAPADADWSRWAMLHDKSAYRLYAFKKGSKDTIYQFAFNPDTEAYEYGYDSIPELKLVGTPADADTSTFAMLHDGSAYRLYLKQRGNPNRLYQFSWVDGTETYKFGHNSIPAMNITGFPADTDWSRWEMLHDGSAYRIYAFKRGSKTQFYQGSFNRANNQYQYGLNSIPVLNLVGMPATNNPRVGLLHDGSAYRLYFLGN